LHQNNFKFTKKKKEEGSKEEMRLYFDDGLKKRGVRLIVACLALITPYSGYDMGHSVSGL